jgi:hypothetical protein
MDLRFVICLQGPPGNAFRTLDDESDDGSLAIVMAGQDIARRIKATGEFLITIGHTPGRMLKEAAELLRAELRNELHLHSGVRYGETSAASFFGAIEHDEATASVMILLAQEDLDERLVRLAPRSSPVPAPPVEAWSGIGLDRTTGLLFPVFAHQVDDSSSLVALSNARDYDGVAGEP